MLKIIQVMVIVEGQTEEAFIKQVVAPNLLSLGINVTPIIFITSIKKGKKHTGGGINLDKLKNQVKPLIYQKNQPFVSTFFDLYALPTNFPNYADAQKCNNLEDKVKLLNQGLNQEIINSFDFLGKRFFAHIQPYELEALLFSDTQMFASIEPNWKIAEEKNQALEKIRQEFESPEHINNSPETAPSKRLEKVLNHPKYSKNNRHIVIAAKKIGLAKIEQECLHFRSWMNQLRQLAK
jgi:hypothetical protein